MYIVCTVQTSIAQMWPKAHQGWANLNDRWSLIKNYQTLYIAHIRDATHFSASHCTSRGTFGQRHAYRITCTNTTIDYYIESCFVNLQWISFNGYNKHFCNPNCINSPVHLTIALWWLKCMRGSNSKNLCYMHREVQDPLRNKWANSRIHVIHFN